MATNISFTDNKKKSKQQAVSTRVEAENIEYVSSFWEWLQAFWNSKRYPQVMVLLAVLFLILDETVLGVLVFAGITAAFLLGSEDLLAAILPLLLMASLSVKHYADFSVFLPYWWVGGILAAALIYHLIRNGITFRRGKNFRGLAAVSAVALLSGTGVLSMKERLAPLSVYYTLGIGAAMLVFYLILFSEISRKRSYSIPERFFTSLYAFGLVTGCVVIAFYAQHLEEFLKNFSVIFFPYRNYCATVLLLCFPASVYYVLRSEKHLLGVGFLYLCMLMTGSRSAMLFGTVLLVLGIFYQLICNKRRRKRYLITLSLCLIPMVFLGLELIELLFSSRFLEEGGLISEEDSRFQFLKRAAADFLSNPLFGIGLGNTANSDIFGGVPGSMVFYHNYFAQIAGSMGLAGLLAYGILLRDRLKILLTGFDRTLAIFAMSYLGVFLVSMTNPGEFCPFPYEMLTVMLFTLAEKHSEDKRTAARVYVLRGKVQGKTVGKSA